MTFQIGQKVVPISKSVSRDLELSSVWRMAQQKNQPFLYVKRIDQSEQEDIIVCHFEVPSFGGDYFLAKDLIPFTDDSRNEEFVHLLKQGTRERGL